MQVRASAKGVRMSARKAQLVVETIRGKPAEEALAVLRFLPHAAARAVYKVVRSAIANAENNYSLDPAALRVVSATADQGPSYPPRTGPRPAARPGSSSAGRRTSPSSWTTSRPPSAPPLAQREEDMGQKVHPIGFRLGSHQGLGEQVVRPAQGVRPAARRGPGHPGPAQAAPLQRQRQPGGDRAQPERGQADHPHGQAGHRHRQAGRGRRGAAAQPRGAHRQEGAGQHHGDPSARAGRRLVARNVAEQLERGWHSGGDEAGRAAHHAHGRQGHQGAGLPGASAARKWPARTRTATARCRCRRCGGHRLRAVRGRDRLRPHRRQGLDLPRGRRPGPEGDRARLRRAPLRRARRPWRPAPRAASGRSRWPRRSGGPGRRQGCRGARRVPGGGGGCPRCRPRCAAARQAPRSGRPARARAGPARQPRRRPAGPDPAGDPAPGWIWAWGPPAGPAGGARPPRLARGRPGPR